MGKPTGFLEFDRNLPTDRATDERIKDYGEFHTHLDEEKLRCQGARCMDCGVPFCHTGKLVSNMAMGCPLNNLIPEWNDLVYRGQYELAYKRLMLTNRFPEFTGRVCPAPCEGSCTSGLNGDPVTIKSIEYHIIEKAYELGLVKPSIPKISTGKRVAVVGSGPAGLACADTLNRLGHSVTVFERADRAGGLLMYGIPNMKLDKRLVMRRTKLMEEEGVKFVLGTQIGADFPAERLLSDFDAVVMCCGSTTPRKLTVSGSELNGVYYAVDFLSQNTKSLLDSNHSDGNFVSAEGKNVVIIGGGDTGTDCVATSIRHGCKSVRQLEIMPKPPEKRGESNPWPQYPRVLKTDYGQEEAIARFGKDPRQYLTTVTGISGDNGKVQSVRTVSVEWKRDESGKMIPSFVKGSERSIKAELVLIAMGFTGPEKAASEMLGIKTDARSNMQTAPFGYQTNVKGVFAAGDCRRGQSLVVWALREGKEAALEADEYLKNQNFA